MVEKQGAVSGAKGLVQNLYCVGNAGLLGDVLQGPKKAPSPGTALTDGSYLVGCGFPTGFCGIPCLRQSSDP